MIGLVWYWRDRCRLSADGDDLSVCSYSWVNYWIDRPGGLVMDWLIGHRLAKDWHMLQGLVY